MMLVVFNEFFYNQISRKSTFFYEKSVKYFATFSRLLEFGRWKATTHEHEILKHKEERKNLISFCRFVAVLIDVIRHLEIFLDGQTIALTIKLTFGGF